jgi:hypothetical protein
LVVGLAGALALGVGPLSAAVIFSDDFESVNPGDSFATPAPWTSLTQGGDGSPSTTLVRNDATGALFGEIDNQYGEFIDPRTSAPAARAAGSFAGVSSSFLTVSFDFYEPNDGVGVGLASNNEPHTFNVQIGTNPSGTSTRAIDFRLGEALLYHRDATAVVRSTANTTDYALGAKNHIDIVANFNALSANYGWGEVASGRFDVWINGALAGDNLPFRVDAQKTGSIVGILVGTDNVTTQNFNIDNITIHNAAVVVPEPEGWLLVALIAMGSFGLVPYRRFRKELAIAG